MTLACETGGRWSSECVALVRALANARSTQYPPALQKSIKLVVTKRFWGLLSVAALKGIASSVEGIGEISDTGAFQIMPQFEELLAGCEVPPEVSRLA